MRIGATIPIAGPGAFDPGPLAAAGRLEEAGYDSVWLADRLLAAIPLRSRYPFNSDGKPRWALDSFSRIDDDDGDDGGRHQPGRGGSGGPGRSVASPGCAGQADGDA